MAKRSIKKDKNNVVLKEKSTNIWSIINIFYNLSRDKKSTLKDLREDFIDIIPNNEFSFVSFVLFKNMLYNNITRLELDNLSRVLVQLGQEIFIEILFLYIKENNIIFPKFMSFYNLNKDYKKILLDKYKGLKIEELEMLIEKYKYYTLRELAEILL
jgi:fucose 4-O-acetylase-like acetyltransferase